MRSRTKRQIALAAFGTAVVALVAVFSDDVFLWYRKQQALKAISAYPPRERATLSSVPAPRTRQLPAPLSGRERVHIDLKGYRLSLPAAEYRLTGEANDCFDGKSLTLRCLDIAPRSADLKSEFQPASEAVRQHLARSDPYDLLVEAFRTTPADIARQETSDGLQKVLYLLFLKSAWQPVGSEKHFEPFQAGGRRGILAGDHTCETLVVLIYLPETHRFAEIVLGNKGLTGLEDVYRCLGLLRIEPIAPASASISPETPAPLPLTP